MQHAKILLQNLSRYYKRKKFKKHIRQNEINEAVKIHLKICKSIHIELKANELTDKKDNYLLDLFRAANASLLVTGDKNLKTEASKLGFKVITLAQFENTAG